MTNTHNLGLMSGTFLVSGLIKSKTEEFKQAKRAR